MSAQQRPGPRDRTGVFTTINGRPMVWTDRAGTVHACEGADVHPGVRLIWTRCHGHDVPANGAVLSCQGAREVTCEACP